MAFILAGIELVSAVNGSNDLLSRDKIANSQILHPVHMCYTEYKYCAVLTTVAVLEEYCTVLVLQYAMHSAPVHCTGRLLTVPIVLAVAHRKPD